MYQTLYRKYRPKTFSDVVGQKHITETLRREVSLERISNAYILVGTRGTGKTSCAKILARAVNCLSPQEGEPCNECQNCKAILSGAATDVAELDAASNNTVDRIRELQTEMQYSPVMLSKRVYIFDEAHMLTTAAWNALLQTIEEPPKHLIFIFATTDSFKIPATITSRCQRFTFRRLSPSDIESHLNYVAQCEGISLEPAAAELLARLADGAMRDGLSILDQCTGAGTVTEEHVREVTGLSGRSHPLTLAESLLGGNPASAVAVVEKTYNGGRLLNSLFSETCAVLRDALISAMAPGETGLLSGIASRKDLSGLKASPAALVRTIKILSEAESRMTRGIGDTTEAMLAIAEVFADTKQPAPEPALIPKVTADAVPARKSEPVERTDEISYYDEPPSADEPQSVTEPRPSPPSGNIWESVLSALRDRQDFLAWLNDARLDITGSTAVITLPNELGLFVLNSEAAKQRIIKEISGITGLGITLQYKTEKSGQKPEKDNFDLLAERAERNSDVFKIK